MRSFTAGLFRHDSVARGGREFFHEAGYGPDDVALVSATEAGGAPVLRLRPESIFRWAVRGALIGALAVELPVALLAFVLAIDASIQVFLASTVWKLGAVMGGLIGVLLGQERGLEPDLARPV